MSSLSSHERMLAALSYQGSDHIPCCFMTYQALQKQCTTDFAFFDRQLELGLDVRVQLPDLPLRFAPEVTVRTWKEHPADESVPLLHRTYHTPPGTIETVVRQTTDWPHGDALPLFDDFVTPRAHKFLVTQSQDLAALRYLLVPPTKDDIAEFHTLAETYRRYANDKGLLLCGGWRDWRNDTVGVVGEQGGTMLGIDALMWLCGATLPLYWTYDQPNALHELIRLITEWDLQRMAIMLEAGAELLIERAWYAGTDFWSPRTYRQFIVPGLREKVALTHQAGAKFAYTMTSGVMPLLDDLLDLGIDVLIGLDPVQGKGTDTARMAQHTAGRMALWGGVCAPMTIEQGTPAAVREAVKAAIDTCGRTGGFILSPVDNIFDNSAQTQQNIHEFVRAWRELRQV